MSEDNGQRLFLWCCVGAGTAALLLIFAWMIK
jgi:hypothetical protein